MLTEQQCELRVEGHADFDRCGRDIVCAAVSALVSALADHVEEEAGWNEGVGRDTVGACGSESRREQV